MKGLRNHLATFDGKHTDVLERVAASLAKSPDAIERLTVIAEEAPDEPVAAAATWQPRRKWFGARASRISQIKEPSRGSYPQRYRKRRRRRDAESCSAAARTTFAPGCQVMLALCRKVKHPAIGAPIAARLGRLLPGAARWETRLHVLQTLGRVNLVELLTKPQLRSLATAAMATAEDPKPFVRAWSLNLLGMIGGALAPDLRRRAARLIAAAERQDPASVRARIRQLRKAGVLDWMPRSRA